MSVKSEFNIARCCRKTLVDLEDEILRLLSEAEGSLLENETLVDTLQQSKLTSDEVTRQLNEAEETEIKIDAKREEFRLRQSEAPLHILC